SPAKNLNFTQRLSLSLMRRSGDMPILRSIITPLYFDGAPHCLGRAGELDKQTVPGRSDDATVMLCNPAIYELMTIRLQQFSRTKSLSALPESSSRHCKPPRCVAPPRGRPPTSAPTISTCGLLRPSGRVT